MTEEFDFVSKCPQCGSDEFHWGIDQETLDDEIECQRCFWNGTRDEMVRNDFSIAADWLVSYVDHQWFVVLQCDGETFLTCARSEQLHDWYTFVQLCFAKGVNPAPFADVMIEFWKMAINPVSFEEPEDESETE